jgi:hypothetical protein
MAEYAGYVPTAPVDYGAISSDFLSKKVSVGQMKYAQDLAQQKLQQKELEAKRKLQREDDKEFKSDLTSLKTPTAVPDQTENTKNYKGLSNSREFLSKLHEDVKAGRITQSDYNRIFSNLSSQWQQVADVTKSYGDNFQKLIETLPKQSPLGAYRIGKLGNAAQSGNKELAPIEDGTLVQYTIDLETGKRIKGDALTNLSLLNNGALYSDIPAKTYTELFSEAEKAIGDYTVESGDVTITDKTKDPKFQSFLANVTNGIIPDDEAKARLLSTLNGFTFYANDKEREQNVAMKLQNLSLPPEEFAIEKKKAEENQIQMVLNSKGSYDVKLTPAQSKLAEAVAKENIIGRIDYKKTKDEPRQTKVVISPENKVNDTKITRNKTLKSSRKSWGNLTSKNKSIRNKEIQRLAALYSSADYPVGGEPKFDKNGNVISIVLHEMEDGKYGPIFKTIKSEEDVFGAFTAKDKKGSEYVDYEAAVEEEFLFDND